MATFESYVMKEKLTSVIPALRVTDEVKQALQEMAEERKRDLPDFLRIMLESVVKKHKEKKSPVNNQQ